MHDAIASERQGTPALAVMTFDFVSAAELMSRVLGLPNYRFAIIDHPVSSADDAGLNQRARTTIQAAREIVLTSVTGRSDGR